MSAHNRCPEPRSICNPRRRLKVEDAIVLVVESATVVVVTRTGAGDDLLPAKRCKVRFPVIYFDPGSVEFPPQAVIQCKVPFNAPGILGESRDECCRAVPRFRRWYPRRQR